MTALFVQEDFHRHRGHSLYSQRLIISIRSPSELGEGIDSAKGAYSLERGWVEMDRCWAAFLAVKDIWHHEAVGRVPVRMV